MEWNDIGPDVAIGISLLRPEEWRVSGIASTG